MSEAVIITRSETDNLISEKLRNENKDFRDMFNNISKDVLGRSVFQQISNYFNEELKSSAQQIRTLTRSASSFVDQPYKQIALQITEKFKKAPDLNTIFRDVERDAMFDVASMVKIDAGNILYKVTSGEIELSEDDDLKLTEVCERLKDSYARLACTASAAQNLRYIENQNEKIALQFKQAVEDGLDIPQHPSLQEELESTYKRRDEFVQGAYDALSDAGEIHGANGEKPSVKEWFSNLSQSRSLSDLSKSMTVKAGRLYSEFQKNVFVFLKDRAALSMMDFDTSFYEEAVSGELKSYLRNTSHPGIQTSYALAYDNDLMQRVLDQMDAQKRNVENKLPDGPK